MQLSDIRTEIRTRMNVGTTDANISNSVLTTLINAALRHISVQYDWPWLEVEATANTVAGTETITLASNVRKVTHMYHEYHELLYRQFRDRPLFYGLTGPPVAFSEQAGVYYVWPTPNAVYTVSYGYILDKEPALSADSDKPLVPDWAISLVITQACILVARRLRDRDTERGFYAEYRDLLQTMTDNIRQVTLGHRPRRVGNR